MTMTLALEKIETGDASPEEARTAIAELLRDGSAKSLRRLYAALGGWIWKTLDRRRRDDELREWFDIIRRTSAALTEKDPAASERLRAFYDLIHTSISTSKVISVEEALSREHVREILLLLYRDKSNATEKVVIAQQLGLNPSNLTRILNLMMDARLVERTTYGKYAQFALTGEGINTAEEITRKAAEVRAASDNVAPVKMGEVNWQKIQDVIDKSLTEGARAGLADRLVAIAARLDGGAHKHAWHDPQPSLRAADLEHLPHWVKPIGLEPIPIPMPNHGSALNQVNVTTVQPTRTYEGSMRGGMVRAWEKTAEPLPIPLPKPTIDAASSVGGLPKGFVAVMASIAREQNSAGR